MAKLTEVKNTKFTYDDSNWMEGIIKRVNETKTDKDIKVKLSAIMRESTLKAVKDLERELNRMDKEK